MLLVSLGAPGARVLTAERNACAPCVGRRGKELPAASSAILGIGKSSCDGSVVDGRVAVTPAAADSVDGAAVADTLLAGLVRMAAETIRADTVSRGRVGGYAGRARAR